MIMRVVFAILGLGLCAAIVWGVQVSDKPMMGEIRELIADNWGLVSMYDLYLGFLVYSVFVWHLEKTLAMRLFWIVPIFALGNIWSAAWIAVRGYKFLSRST